MYYSNALGLFSSLCKQGALCWVETDGPCVFWTAFLFCICINNWTHGGSSSCGQVESIGHVIRCEDFTLFSVLEGLGSQNIKKINFICQHSPGWLWQSVREEADLVLINQPEPRYATEIKRQLMDWRCRHYKHWQTGFSGGTESRIYEIPGMTKKKSFKKENDLRFLNKK